MSAVMNSNVIEVNRLSKSFHDGDINVHVLKNVQFAIPESSRIAIVGASGSGKSTLLQLLGGLDKPTEGEVILCGNNLNQVDDTTRGKLRNKHLGFHISVSSFIAGIYCIGECRHAVNGKKNDYQRYSHDGK